MQTTTLQPTVQPHMRQRKRYDQAMERGLSSHILTDAEKADHKARFEKLGHTPATFEEYREWLRIWRQVYAEEVRRAQAYRRAHTVYKLAGGFDRYFDNTPLEMNDRIREGYAAAEANLGPQVTAYDRRCRLLRQRIDNKPLGKQLWLDQGPKK